MSQCLEGCKWTCIIGYVLASLGALVLSYNTLTDAGKRKPFLPPVSFLWAYLVGALITLWCSFRWGTSSSVKK